jgi:hypothetical protein
MSSRDRRLVSRTLFYIAAALVDERHGSSAWTRTYGDFLVLADWLFDEPQGQFAITSGAGELIVATPLEQLRLFHHATWAQIDA